MTEQEKVISFIKRQYGSEEDKKRFRVFDNTAQEKKIVGGVFPDIIFLQPEPPPNNNILFVLKVESGNSFVDHVSEWKALGSTPSVFYLVVPRSKLDEAKKLVSATGVRARFAWYEMTGEEVTQVNYE